MKINDNTFIEYVAASISYAEVCRRIGIRPTGGNYKTVKSRINRLGLDVSHFTGQAWNLGNKYSNRAKPLGEVLVKNSSYSTYHLKKRLFKEGVKEKRCEKCKLTSWNNKPISLELDHINGDNTDNRIENLRILCPNCHSQTKYYRGRNQLSALSEKKEVEFRKFRETLTCNDDGNPELSLIETAETRHGKPTSQYRMNQKYKKCACGKDIKQPRRKYCSQKCYQEYGIKSKCPKVPELLKTFKERKNYIQVGKYYGVSHNAVRKWLKKLGIEDMVKE